MYKIGKLIYYQPSRATVRIKEIRYEEYIAWHTIDVLPVSVAVIIVQKLKLSTM